MVIIEMGRTEFFFNQSDFRNFPSLTQLVTVMQCWAKLKVWHKKYNNERWFFHGLMNIFHHVTQTRASSKYVSILLPNFWKHLLRKNRLNMSRLNRYLMLSFCFLFWNHIYISVSLSFQSCYPHNAGIVLIKVKKQSVSWRKSENVPNFLRNLKICPSVVLSY